MVHFEVDKIIKDANPKLAIMRFASGGRCGNEGVFNLCRLLKAHINDFEEAEVIIKRWYQNWKADLVDETGQTTPYEEIFIMAKDVWPKVKYGRLNKLAIAIIEADGNILDGKTILEVEGYRGEPERRLALVCYGLSEIEKPKPFHMSGYIAAEVMGLDRINGQKRGRMTLRVFMQRSAIAIAKKGNEFSATRYFFTGTPPVLRESENQRLR